ncbi:MAG: hypothetical protein FWD73_14800 [Polyangiaceae bacterium]|nr:hypothetical protein [Polyangiaceae bacterium]
MTREQIETILMSSGAKADKDSVVLPEGANITFHIAHDGASLSVQKIEMIRFLGDLVYAKSSKQTIALITQDIFAVAMDGTMGQPGRRQPGFF